MAQLLLVDFAIGPPGTPVPDDFYTPEGVRVTLPAASKLTMFGAKVGIEVPEKVGLTLPASATEVDVRGAAGANPPVALFIAPDGTLLKAFLTIKQPDHSIAAHYVSADPIARVELVYPNGEGVMFTLAALLGSAVPFFMRQVELTVIDPGVCQAIVYGETGTIEATEEQLPGLAEARRFIAGVAYKRNGSGMAKPKYPTPDELKQPFIKRAWDRCKKAADDAKNDDVGKCKHFVIWYSDDNGKTPSKKPTEIPDKWPYEQVDKIKGSWGPYEVNELGKDNIYVIKYCGVP